MRPTKLKQLALRGIGSPVYWCSYCSATVEKDAKVCPICKQEFVRKEKKKPK